MGLGADVRDVRDVAEEIAQDEVGWAHTLELEVWAEDGGRSSSARLRRAAKGSGRRRADRRMPRRHERAGGTLERPQVVHTTTSDEGTNQRTRSTRPVDDGWLVRFDGYDPADEGRRETLCTLGNGYLATRGAAPESSADVVHYPGTYAAGIYNRLQGQVGGEVVETESIVNLPNWLRVDFRTADGPWFDVDTATLLEYRQELDLRRALLTRSFRFRDPAGRTTSVHQRRLVHLRAPHVCALEVTFVAEDWSGALEIRSLVDGGVWKHPGAPLPPVGHRPPGARPRRGAVRRLGGPRGGHQPVGRPGGDGRSHRSVDRRRAGRCRSRSRSCRGALSGRVGGSATA